MLITISAFTISQVPHQFSYQAILRNADGTVKANEPVTVQIIIRQTAADGLSVYLENHNTSTNYHGLINLIIGEGTTSDDFSLIDWSKGPYFLDVTVNGVEIGSNRILTVPYALYAKQAGDRFSGAFDDLTGIPDFSGWDKDSADDVSIERDQSISGNKIFTGTIAVPEPVGPTDAATKDYIDKTLEAYGIILPENFAGTIIDIDGNTYRTVTIGTQTWMAENLRVGRTNDDVEIRFFEDDALWNETHSPAYCWYRNDFHCKDVYGLLYNWYAVDCGSLCPAGWHVPTNGDWETLLTYLGDIALAGGKLKEKGTAHWSSPNRGATDEEAFTALPGGYRKPIGVYAYPGNDGYWWSATEFEEADTHAWHININYWFSILTQDISIKNYGYSVRCIKDEAVLIEP